jgi:threonine dehydratase
LKDLVDEYVTVTENEIAATIVKLLNSSRTLTEGAGCLGLAAILEKKIKVKPNEKIAIILCGGNIQMTTLRRIYEYGLRSMGRFFSVHITTSDEPGNLSKVIAIAAKSELQVHEVRHIRGVGDINWNETTLSISFYSHNFHHQIPFLIAVVKQLGRIPVIVGRSFIQNHEEIYKVCFEFLSCGEKRNLTCCVCAFAGI